MLKSKEELLSEASEKNYKPENLDKVYHLLNIFQQFMSIPFLNERLVLKGGTALNLFYHETTPRLSLDLDCNYIGSLDKKIMLQNQYELYRNPNNHAGGKSIWYYNSALGQRGALEIDINYMYRKPLWPITHKAPNFKNYPDWKAPILDIHELSAGKLTALFNRRVSRDFFDAHYLLGEAILDTAPKKP